MKIPNPFRIHAQERPGQSFRLPDNDMAAVRNAVTVQMLRRLQIFNAIIFLIHLVILIFIVPGNIKVYQGERLQTYMLMNYCDLAIVIGSLILFILATVTYPRSADRVNLLHRSIVLFNCFLLLFWAAFKTGFQQSFDGQISIYLVVLLTAGAGVLLDVPGSLAVYIPPFAAFIIGTILNNKSMPLLQDNLINGSALTVVSWVVGRILYQNYSDNLVKQKIIERQKTELQESEEKFAKSFQFNSVGMAILTIPEGRYVDINDEFIRVSGLNKEQVIGHTAIELGFWIRPEDRNGFLERFLKEGFLKDYEMDFRLPSGEIISLNAYLIIIHLKGIPYQLFSVQDITERKKAEQNLLKLNTELSNRVAETVSQLREKDQMMLLQSRQAAMGDMLSNIAHQWRQPLNSVGIIIQTIEEYYKTDHLSEKFLNDSVNNAMNQIQHMSKTIDDFRNFFKPDKEKKEFNLKNEVENTISLISASYKVNFIEISMVCADEIVITGYPNEFSQVLLNILNNSLDVFQKTKPEKPLVKISICREKGRSVLTITDNAGGIPTDVLHRIFDPFFTTKDNGTGIGLYMAKTIIEKNMGGRLTARNFDQGAEFRIEL